MNHQPPLPLSWEPPASWPHIRTVDMHTGGEPVRIIVDGFPPVRGRSILECRRFVKQHYDHLRKALMWEPRGHADMYGVLLLPPERADSDIGVLFLHNEGYSTMCGHATLAITKIAVEMGWVNRQEPLTTMRIDAPCGQLTAYATLADGKVTGVSFDNVPSFVVALDAVVQVPGLGEVRCDLAYGGAFYAYVRADQIGLVLSDRHYRRIIEWGMAIKQAVMDQYAGIRHPFEEDLSFLYGTIFIADSDKAGIHSRNVCVFADGEVDRSATGSGVSGRAAIHHARQQLPPGETILIESLVGSTMGVSIIAETTFGPYPAVIPRVSGQAHYTGRHEFWIDPEDPLREGFILR